MRADTRAAIESLEQRALLTANLTIDLSASQDNTLYEDPAGEISNGSGEHFFAGTNFALENGNTTQNIRRGLIEFDLESLDIPAGSTITDAVLTLHMSRTNAEAAEIPISLHTVNADWGEGNSDADGNEGGGAVAEANDATWLSSFFGTADWAVPGGDFSSTPSATTNVDGVGFYQWNSEQLVADVQAWFDGATENFGWALLGLEQNGSATAKRFDSRENSNSAFQPVLTLTYDEPILPGFIQGQKWHDTNANGIFDTNEQALNGWTIELIDSTGTVVETTRTSSVDVNNDGIISQNERGAYKFDVFPGEYVVREVQQTGWQQSAPEFFSDLRPENVITNINVTSEGAGAIWYVLNEDTNELSYNISTDELDGNITAAWIHQGTAGSSGNNLHNLFDGSANASFIQGTVSLTDSEVIALNGGELYIQLYTSAWPGGELRDQIRSGNQHYVTITSDAQIFGRDFGNYRFTSISGRKWNDINNDGVRLSQDVIDLGLFIQNNNLFFDAYGGEEVWFRGPAGEWFFLTSDGTLTEWDRTPFALSGTVVAQLDPSFYNDPEGLANADEAEPFLNGWTIELLNGEGEVVATDVTRDVDLNGDGIIDPENERGRYFFEDLIPGNYDVREVLQEGWAQSATITSVSADLAYQIDQQLGLTFTGNLHTNFGGLGENWMLADDGAWYYITPAGELYEWDGTSGGDAGPLTGTLVAVLGREYHANPSLLYNAADPTLGTTSGAELINVDFGNYQTVSIHGRKWHDINNDGLRPPTELDEDYVLRPPSEVSLDGDGGGESFLFNVFGSNEYWFQNDMGEWFFLLPDGNVYEWDGTPGSATGTVAFHAGAGFYNDPSQLVTGETAPEPYLNGWTIELLDENGFVIATDVTHDFDINGDGEIDPETERGWYRFDDLPPGTYSVQEIQQEGWVQIFPVQAEFARAAQQLDAAFGFQTSGNFHRNFGGQNEVWIQDENNRWFYITEDGNLFQWDTVSNESTGLSGTLIASLSQSFNLNPSLLYEPMSIDVTLESGDFINDYNFGNKLLDTEI